MKTSDEYIIPFSGLAAGKHTFSWEIDGSFFEVDNYTDISDASIHVDCILQKSQQLMELEFKGKGTITLPCDRCLAPLTIATDTQRKVIVQESAHGLSEDDDIYYIGRQEHEVSVANWIREMILLSVPMRNTHPDGSCDSGMIDKLQNLSDKNGIKPFNE